MTMMLDDPTLIVGPYVLCVYCWHVGVSLICSRARPMYAGQAAQIRNLVYATLARVSCLCRWTLVANNAGCMSCSTLPVIWIETTLQLSFWPTFVGPELPTI